MRYTDPCFKSNKGIDRTVQTYGFVWESKLRPSINNKKSCPNTLVCNAVNFLPCKCVVASNAE